jgi:hypothetical protein
VVRGQYTGLLPSLFQYAEISLTTGSAESGPCLPNGLRPGGPSSAVRGAPDLGLDADVALGVAFVRAANKDGALRWRATRGRPSDSRSCTGSRPS